jgi:hypothetical protein
MIIATAKAMRPRSSAAAKPMNSRPCWLSAAAGLRRAEHVADADGGGADANRRKTCTDDLSGSEIHVKLLGFEL